MQQQRKQPVEFNHAINYVNKIKTRFNNQPETYKSFLEILHTYQKEQKSIKEVYDQVAILFQHHADLLGEFSQFLPEAVPHQQAAQAAAYAQQQQQSAAQGRGHLPPPSAPATAENFGMHGVKKGSKPIMSRQYNKRTSEKAGIPSSNVATMTSSMMSGSVAKKSKLRHMENQSFAPPSSADVMGMDVQMTDVRVTRGGGSSSAVSAVAPMMVNLPPSSLLPPGSSPIAEEWEFFERVKRSLNNNKYVYGEFLKCLNLFSQEIVSKQELVHLVHTFLGKEPELFEWFKRFVAYKEAPDSVVSERKPFSNNFPQIDYNKCKRYGPSYRALPKAFQQPQCSGRTELCREVLNDTWVSFPCWSEDSPFLASRKNIHEETIYKAEDERYELDHALELNKATIKTLEAVHEKLQKMPAEEAQRFRLGDNLGGTSEVIYLLAIKKVYADHAAEVIENLKRHPMMILPIVINRLKQKDEEWRKAQREWNKIWRELYVKNYYKSLDYQGINFRQNDKKSTVVRQLVQEAEILLSEQHERIGDMVLSKPPFQFEFNFSEYVVLEDVLRLVFSNLDKIAMSNADRRRVVYFFKEIFPRFFARTAIATPAPTKTEGNENDANNASSDSKMAVPVSKVDPAGPNVLSLYANNSIYAFVRILQFCYSRLLKMKQLSVEAAKPKQINAIAKELAFHQPKPSTTVGPYEQLLELIERLLESKLDANQFEDAVRDIYGTSAYPMFTMDKLIVGLVRQAQSIMTERQSERLIQIFGKEYSYPFEIEIDESDDEDDSNKDDDNDDDDEKDKDYEDEKPSTANGGGKKKATKVEKQTAPVNFDGLKYREKAELIIGKVDNCFRLDYIKEDRNMRIRLFARATSGRVDETSVEEAWSVYVDHYVHREVTEPELQPKRTVFLKRNKQKAETVRETVEVSNQLECKICVNTYKIFYVENTEDYLKHHKTRPFSQQQAAAKSAKFRQWLEGPRGWAREQSADGKAKLHQLAESFLLHSQHNAESSHSDQFVTGQRTEVVQGVQVLAFTTTTGASSAAAAVAQEDSMDL